jgi:membrane-bound hydrogenase subunit beta
MTERVMTPEQVVDLFKEKCGPGIQEIRVTERKEGAKKRPNYNIWISLDRELLKPAIRELISLQFPHFSVISGIDTGDAVRLIYHLTIFYGHPGKECTVSLGVDLPKSDLTIPTISDLIPGAVFSEREKQEFLGVRVVDIPDGRRLFLPDDFPKGVYPWRKDETGIPESMIKNLYLSRRPTDRPSPQAEAKEMCPIEGESSGEEGPP